MLDWKISNIYQLHPLVTLYIVETAYICFSR